MRNPERITKLCQLIEERWKRQPDLRFMQFLQQFLPKPIPGWLFAIEDDRLIYELRGTSDIIDIEPLSKSESDAITDYFIENEVLGKAGFTDEAIEQFKQFH